MISEHSGIILVYKEELKSFLVGKYGMKVSFARSQTLKGFIDGVRLESLPDIATLSTVYSFNEMLGFYVSKFPNVNALDADSKVH